MNRIESVRIHVGCASHCCSCAQHSLAMARARAWGGRAHSHIRALSVAPAPPRVTTSRSAHDTLCPRAADNIAMKEEAQEEEGNAHHEACLEYGVNGPDIAADNMAAHFAASERRAAESRKTRADAETSVTHHAERAMQRAVSVLEEVADPERNPAPSQQPHPAWRLDLPVDRSDTGPQRLNRLQANAWRFLSQGINGGTEAALRLIVGILFTPQLLTIQAPFDSGGGSSSSLVISGGGSSSSALRSGSASNVTVFVIFDGKGRLKNSVKRSLRNFDKVNVDRVQVDDPDAKWWENSLTLLQAVPIRDVLSHVLRSPEKNMMQAWQGNNSFGDSVITYLQRRITSTMESADTATSAQSKIQDMCSGLDPLGPGRSRKRAAAALLCGPAAPPLRLMGPTTTAPAMPSRNPALQLDPPSEEANRLREVLPLSDEAYRLREMLAWSEGLSCEQAAEKAAKLVELLRELLEENYTHRIAAAARRAQDETNVCPLPHAASFPRSP